MEDIVCLIVLICECLFLRKSVGIEIWHLDVFVAASLMSIAEVSLTLTDTQLFCFSLWELYKIIKQQKDTVHCSWELLFVSVTD